MLITISIKAFALSVGLLHANKLESVVACLIIPLAIILKMIEVSHQHSGTMLIAKHVIWIISPPVLITIRKTAIGPYPCSIIYLVRESYPSLVITTRCIKECCFDEVVDRCWLNFYQLGPKIRASCISIEPGLWVVDELVAEPRWTRGPSWINK